MSAPRDHGGGLDAAIAVHGGARADWMDLSTGINPHAYPVPRIPHEAWAELPDECACRALEHAARAFWDVPDVAAALAAPGLSALISRLPGVLPPQRVRIDMPTYNEYAAAFSAAGWEICEASGKIAAEIRVIVHPNNPTGDFWIPDRDKPAGKAGPHRIMVIDESFCDLAPARSLIHMARQPGVLILKSFGKFWGLAGLRLGFAFGDPAVITPLREALGPWPVSGPALSIATRALADRVWAEQMRARLARDAARLNILMVRHGAKPVGGTDLFRLYEVPSARQWQDSLAGHRIWSRIFPYSDTWLRLGIPGADGWPRLEAAL